MTPSLQGASYRPRVGGLIFLMLVLGNSKRLARRFRSGWVSNLLVGLACLLMALLPLAYLLVK